MTATTSRPVTTARSFRLERSPNAIPSLDGVRCIAILLVILRHGVNPYWGPDSQLFPIGSWDLGTPLTNGWVGVDLFFVLSGFLITYQIVMRYGTSFAGTDLPNYVFRRAVRIIPAYYASVLIAISGLVPLFTVNPQRLTWRVGYHLVFLQDYLPADIVVAFWSLGVEEKFYLLAPLVIMAALKITSLGGKYALLGSFALTPIVLRAMTVAGGTTVDTYGAYFTTFRSPFHLTFDGLAVGVIAACIFLDRERFGWTQSRRHVSTLFVVGAGSFLALLVGAPHMDSITRFDMLALQPLLAWSCGCALLGLVLGGGPQRALGANWMYAISKLSFTWYLLHLLFLPLGVRSAEILISANGTAANAVRFVVCLAVYGALSLVAALLLHLTVEQPCMDWRNRRSD